MLIKLSSLGCIGIKFDEGVEFKQTNRNINQTTMLVIITNLVHVINLKHKIDWLNLKISFSRSGQSY